MRFYIIITIIVDFFLRICILNFGLFSMRQTKFEGFEKLAPILQ